MTLDFDATRQLSKIPRGTLSMPRVRRTYFYADLSLGYRSGQFQLARGIVPR